MNSLSKFRNGFGLSLFPGAKDAPNPPMMRLCRIYGMLAIGATLLISVCFYFNSWIWERIEPRQTELFSRGFFGAAYLSKYGFLLNWAGFLMLAGAIIYGLKIARQASLDAHRNEKLLQETKQHTMEIAALYDTLHDVSEKQELRALLQTILERARTLLTASGCAIFLFDKDHDDFQIAVEVGVGMPIGTHLSRSEGLAGRVAETLEPVIVNDYQTWPYRSKALQQLPIRAAVCVPMIRGGELIGVLGVHEFGAMRREFADADARLLSLFADNAAGAVHTAQLLDALQNSEERFRIAAQCASDIVYDWDLVGDHADYFGALFEKSRAADVMPAGTREEYWNLIHPDDRARVEQALKSHFETGAPFSEEYRIGDGKGSYVNVADRATAIRNQRGVPIRLIGAASNITQRKQAEQMKSDFISFVTHQLRTPLSGVKWMLELATDTIDDTEESRSYIHDARLATDRLIGMVNDLLDISRLERGKLQMTFRNLDITETTKAIIDELTSLSSEKQQTLLMETADSLLQVNGDAQLLRQAILNLVSNAVKYTPSGGTIQVRIARKEGQVLWSVRDTGIGIPKADIGKLFEKFYRAANVLAVETEGTGLGLYLVRLIIDRFGGKVWCESTEGAGSTFLFTLPLAG